VKTTYQFDLDTYRRVREQVLPDDARVELIDGEIVQMASIGRRHQ